MELPPFRVSMLRTSLPEDVWLKIMGFCPAEQLAALCATDTRLRTIGRHPPYWRSLFVKLAVGDSNAAPASLAEAKVKTPSRSLKRLPVQKVLTPSHHRIGIVSMRAPRSRCEVYPVKSSRWKPLVRLVSTPRDNTLGRHCDQVRTRIGAVQGHRRVRRWSGSRTDWYSPCVWSVRSSIVSIRRSVHEGGPSLQRSTLGSRQACHRTRYRTRSGTQTHKMNGMAQRTMPRSHWQAHSLQLGV